MRLRGTWDRPVLLGHIHLLGGQMPFRGNTYQLTRGDINFANPFRLDPDSQRGSHLDHQPVSGDHRLFRTRQPPDAELPLRSAAAG